MGWYKRDMGLQEDDRERAYRELLALHGEVDRAACELTGRLPFDLECRLGCDSCCIDGISVFEIEAGRIRRNHRALLSTGAPHPEGKCAFLDGEGACRIYGDRPYVCRTQGLPLRWFTRDEAAGEDEMAEMRDICPLNEPGELLELIGGEDCWTIGPNESRLVGLQERYGGGEIGRVPLRSLFK
jgi:hypothetical protein